MRSLALACTFNLVAASASLAAMLTEHQATDRAAAILKGDPYGSTTEQVLGRIRQTALVSAGSTPCGKVSRPVWSFHIVVASADQPIDGVLDIDARSGKTACATLPFLD